VLRLIGVSTGSAAKGKSAFNSSTAWRNETPRCFMTQSIGPPPIWQPKQCHRFFEGVTTSDGSPSS
jgi:hypothetical protein